MSHYTKLPPYPRDCFIPKVELIDLTPFRVLECYSKSDVIQPPPDIRPILKYWSQPNLWVAVDRHELGINTRGATAKEAYDEYQAVWSYVAEHHGWMPEAYLRGIPKHVRTN